MSEHDVATATEDGNSQVDATSGKVTATMEDTNVEDVGASSELAPTEKRPSSVTVKRLEEEGEIAADYLEELLDIADLDGDIDLSIDHGRAFVEIVADESGQRRLTSLVGGSGDVLDALQELTRLAVQARTGDRSRLMLDISGYRQARKSELTAVTEEAIAQVKGGAGTVSMDPMNPFERKVVHDVVAAAGLRSDSEGTEPNRHVVIAADR